MIAHYSFADTNCPTLKTRAAAAVGVIWEQWLKQWSRNTRYQDMLELATRRRQRKLCTLYKIVNNISEYPSPPLIPRNPYYLSRSVHCLSFVHPYAHTNQYFYSFFPHTVSLWNNLPYDVVSIVPFGTFKCRILDAC